MTWDYKPNTSWDARVDESNCRASVPDAGRSVGFHQCSRKALPGQKYCRQHSPEARAARRAALDKRYEEQRKLQAEWAVKGAVKLLRSKGYTVTPPKGDA